LRIRIDDKLTDRLYVALSALGDPCTQRDGVEWNGSRGWLDEMEKIVRKRVFENMAQWSNRRSGASNEGVNEPMEDSNSDPCMTEWWPLLSRGVSVTFSNDTDEKEWIEHVLQACDVRECFRESIFTRRVSNEYCVCIELVTSFVPDNYY
jgi:hypothetical protein